MLPYTVDQFIKKCIFIERSASLGDDINRTYTFIYNQLQLSKYFTLNIETFDSLCTQTFAKMYSQAGSLEDMYTEIYNLLHSGEIPAASTDNIIVAQPQFDIVTHGNAYNAEQTPTERLRNMLSPFSQLVQLLQAKDQSPFKDGNKMASLYASTEKVCQQNLHNLHFYLQDVERFYESKK